MKTHEEIGFILKLARENGAESVVIDGIQYFLGKEIFQKSEEVRELKPEEIVAPMSAFEELSDEEIKYYATPYYDELQRLKEERSKKLIEEENLRAS